MKFSIIIPVYNEDRAIKKTMDNLLNLLILKYAKENFEIIVVNDASSDETGTILKNINHPNIKIIHHEKNKGYGSSLKTGIKNAQFELIVITDADGTYPLQDIPDLLSNIKQYDMVVGQRMGDNVDSRFLQKPAKFILKILAQYLTNTVIPDLNSGLRVFRKKDALRFWYFYPTGFSFTTTITLSYLTNDLTIKYLPINYHQRIGKSSIRPLRDFKAFINLIFKMMLFFKPMKIFLPLSFFFFLLGAIIGLWSYFYTPQFMDATTSLLIIFSIQTFFFGLLANLIITKQNTYND